MHTDRVMKLFLGAIAVLLTALILQSAIQSPPSAFAQSDEKIFDTRLIKTFEIEDMKEVVPLGVDTQLGFGFVVRTKENIQVYRMDYFYGPAEDHSR